jgi:hypothetical protein
MRWCERSKTEVKERLLVDEAIDPYGIEGFGHVQDHRAYEPLLAKIPSYSFDVAD